MIANLAKFWTIVVMRAAVLLQDAAAQRYSRWNTEQNEPPPSEVVVARWTFGHNDWFGGYATCYALTH